ncbi:serine hydrolase [Flammeovirga sp. MY04]|uniref:serine hydrolase domain-containing protein n=1 Tax=Flammeovirga sp. MY04 TaxID=1191459 RepID=UPI00080613F3|nr:serine hydrolase [Flammeovirga sp. MY04]ANQ51177.1 serine hydrolase [Flammeovirga sp. MY04]
MKKHVKSIGFIASAVTSLFILNASFKGVDPKVETKPTLQYEKYATAKEIGLMEGFPTAVEKQVTKKNALLTPPYNRWSYLHMREIYPSAPIKAAEKGIDLKSNIDMSLDEIQVIHPETEEHISMDTFLKHTYTDALVVVKGDQIVYERYDNEMHPNQPHQMMSVTKSFGGLLGLLAVEEGKLSENDLVSDHIPELKKSSSFADATFQHVLDMTNSMDFNEDYADPYSGIRQYGAVLGWTEKVEGIKYKDNLYDYLQTLEKKEGLVHGAQFNYNTPKTDVVNWVTNRVNNQSFQEAMHDQLWSKVGTEGDTYVLLDNNATLVAGGGLNATPYNLARFATMMINDGKFNGQQVVAPSVIKKLQEGGNIKAFDNGSESHDTIMPKGEWSYRAQWWIKHTKGQEAVMAIGIHGQWIYLDIEHQIAIIKQSSQPVSKDDVLNAMDLNGFYAIVNHLK